MLVPVLVAKCLSVIGVESFSCAAGAVGVPATGAGAARAAHAEREGVYSAVHASIHEEGVHERRGATLAVRRGAVQGALSSARVLGNLILARLVLVAPRAPSCTHTDTDTIVAAHRRWWANAAR